MKYLHQIAIIMLITFIGEALSILIPLPIPASIYGLVILFIALYTRIIPLDAVQDVGKLLIQLMPIMFIPAGVGLISSWDKLAPIIIPVGIITFVSTVIVMVISGKFTDVLLARTSKKENQHEG